MIGKGSAYAICPLAAIAALACASPRATTATTALTRQACMAPAAAVREEFAGKDLGVQECPGVGGWRVLFVSSDENSWIELRDQTHRWSAEDEVVYRQPIGQFPRVDDTFPVEWRSRDGRAPDGVIFRVAAQRQDDPAARLSVLYVVRLGPPSCVIGREASIDAARALADSSRGCS